MLATEAIALAETADAVRAEDLWRDLFHLDEVYNDADADADAGADAESDELVARTLRVERLELDGVGRVTVGHYNLVELREKSKLVARKRQQAEVRGCDTAAQHKPTHSESDDGIAVKSSNQELPERADGQHLVQQARLLPLGKYPVRSLETATWAPEHQTFLRKTAICKRAMMISYTYCIVTVYGLGVAGRIFNPGGGTPKMLLFEVYSVWDSSTQKMTLTMAQLGALLRDQELLSKVGRKHDLVDGLLMQLYFDYYISLPGRMHQHSGDSGGENSTAGPLAADIVLEHVEDPCERLRVPSVPELIARLSSRPRETAEGQAALPQLRQVLRISTEQKDSGAATRRLAAEIRRKQQEDEAQKQTQAWLATPKMKRGRVWARGVRWQGLLFVLTGYQLVTRLGTLIVRLYHPPTCRTFTANFSLTEAGKLYQVQEGAADWSSDVRHGVLLRMMKQIRLRYFRNGETAALTFRHRVGPAFPALPKPTLPGMPVTHDHNSISDHGHVERSRQRPWIPERYIDLRETFHQTLGQTKHCLGPKSVVHVHSAVEWINSVRSICKVQVDTSLTLQQTEIDAATPPFSNHSLTFIIYIPSTTPLQRLGILLPAGSEYKLQLMYTDIWRILGTEDDANAVFQSAQSGALSGKLTISRCVKQVLSQLSWVLPAAKPAAASQGICVSATHTYLPGGKASGMASAALLYCPSCIFHKAMRVQCGDERPRMIVRVHQRGSTVQISVYDPRSKDLYTIRPASQVEQESLISWLRMSILERTINISTFLEGLVLETDSHTSCFKLALQYTQPAVEVGELARDFEWHREQTELITANAVLKVKSRGRQNRRLGRR